MNTPMNRMSGFGNWNGGQQFYQTNATGLVEKSFYAFIPVNGDVVFDYLQEQGSITNVASAYNVSGTFYQNQLYTGKFAKFILTSGEILIYLNES